MSDSENKNKIIQKIHLTTSYKEYRFLPGPKYIICKCFGGDTSPFSGNVQIKIQSSQNLYFLLHDLQSIDPIYKCPSYIMCGENDL